MTVPHGRSRTPIEPDCLALDRFTDPRIDPGRLARMLRFGRKKTQQTSRTDPWSLDRPMLRFGGTDAWTIRDACAGTLIFGDTGSGKTSGSGQTITMAMLEAGFGGLVLTAKSSETDRSRKYMDRCGRTEDLVVFSPEGPHRFNFMEYERRRMTRGGGKGCCVYIIQTVSNYHHTLGPGGH